METTDIDPLARVEKGALLGAGVKIEAFAVVKASVTLEDNVCIKSHAYIDGDTRIGEGSTVYPSAVIGTQAQDLKFQGEKTAVRIGKGCTIREFVSINASCGEGSVVKVGEDCLIMAYCHIAHNCEIGDRVIMSNACNLAGHVIIENDAVVGGMTAVHQFARIGQYAMVGGLSRLTHDVPPFSIGFGSPYCVGGLNRVGLRRKNFSVDRRSLLAKALRILYDAKLSQKEAILQIRRDCLPSSDVEELISFCLKSERGLIGRRL